MDDVKGELLERYKVLPALSSRLSDLESQNDELREKNRQMEQKLATMQVMLVILVHLDDETQDQCVHSISSLINLN